MPKQSLEMKIEKLIAHYRKNATACERIIYNNRPGPNGENRAGDESFKALLGAKAQLWLWNEVASELQSALDQTKATK